MRQAGQFILHDDSRNGTFVNNERVAGVRPLENDDWIKIGRNTVLKFVDGADPEADYVMTMYNAAMTDPLTGVFNRRYLEQQLEKEASFAKRHDTPLSLAMLDLDNFKEVNDILGHQAGDQVLKDFAALVQRSIRTEDTMGRYGGEEFLVICRSDVRGAKAEAERIRANTEAFLFLSETDQVRRTVSIGVAGFDPRRQTVEELIARADQAMYRAKSQGRNCVCACADERS
jgi:diguanylate cyclase (GGDEF)-like protein